MKNLAQKAARRAGIILMDNLQKVQKKDFINKQDRDFVTWVDKLSEQTIIDTIKEECPEHTIIAEESGLDEQYSEYAWIIDPLDGTTNYLHHYPFFCVSIALQLDGKTVVGVIYDPVKEEMFVAEKSCGVILNNNAIRVSQIDKLASSLLVTGFPFRETDKLDMFLKYFKNIFLASFGMRRDGSAALDLAYIAAGRLEGFWEFGLSAWDVAAGDLMVREAGGTVSTLIGEEHYLKSGNILATNGLIHSELEELIRKLSSKDEKTIDLFADLESGKEEIEVKNGHG